MLTITCMVAVFELAHVLGTITSSTTIDTAVNNIQEQPLFTVSLKEKWYFGTDYHHFCTGTILSKDWVLTAGHCFSHRHKLTKSYIADIGSEYLSNTNGTRYHISEIHMHPNQSESIQIYKNDLCLLKLEKPIQFSSKVQAVHLGTIKDQKELPVIASGWGRTSQTGALHQKLRFVDFKTLKFEDCKRMHAKRNNLIDTETHICAYAGIGKSLCFGDSGGPLVDPATGYQVGVFSALEDCSGEYPVLFMRMEPFIEWINEVTKKNFTLN